VAGRFATEAATVGCDLKVAAPDHVLGMLDRVRTEQVVANLMSNALKYGQGSPVEVTLAVARGGERARLTVRDHGIGIEADDIARIFDRFERAVAPNHYGGFGLGLWIVRQIVEASGGSVAVESAPGQGSTFTLELPLHRGDV